MSGTKIMDNRDTKPLSIYWRCTEVKELNFACIIVNRVTHNLLLPEFTNHISFISHIQSIGLFRKSPPSQHPDQFCPQKT